MSDGSEFHRSDAATGKERRLTVVSRNGGTSICCDDKHGGDWVGQRHELAGSARVALDLVIHKMP